MPQVDLAEDIQPLSEFRAHAASFVDRVRQTHRPLVLTQHGRGSAVLVDIGIYQQMVDELEILRDIKLAEEQFARGEGVPHEQAKAQLLARYPL